MKKIPMNQDDLVEMLVPDPNNTEQLQMLFGWLGKSSRKGYVRLYDSLELLVYVEFKEEDVVLTKSMESSDNPLGGTLVWLPLDAKVITTGNNESNVTERSFLSGEMQEELNASVDGWVFEDDIMGMAYGLTRGPRCRRKPRPFKKTLFWASCRPCCW